MQMLLYLASPIDQVTLALLIYDVSNGTVVIEGPGKRKRGIYREIPIPGFLLNDLDDYCDKVTLQKGSRLWSFSFRTASGQIKRVMKLANIKGVRGCAEGLRHGFAANAVTRVPLTLVKKWLGHCALLELQPRAIR